MQPGSIGIRGSVEWLITRRQMQHTIQFHLDNQAAQQRRRIGNRNAEIAEAAREPNQLRERGGAQRRVPKIDNDGTLDAIKCIAQLRLRPRIKVAGQTYDQNAPLS
jgi:hypothetical protein